MIRLSRYQPTKNVNSSTKSIHVSACAVVRSFITLRWIPYWSAAWNLCLRNEAAPFVALEDGAAEVAYYHSHLASLLV